MRYVVNDDDGCEVYRAAADLIARNPQGGSLRDTTVVPASSSPGNTEGQALYADALRHKLAADPGTTCLRVTSAGGGGLEMLRHLTRQLPAEGPDLATDRAPGRGNGRIRSRVALDNPLCANVLIGENEAIIAIPASRERPTCRPAW